MNERIVVTADDLYITQNTILQNERLQRLKETADKVFNKLTSLIDCDLNKFKKHKYYTSLALIAKKNKQELILLSFEISIFIELVKTEFYDLSKGAPFLSFTDFFLNHTNVNHFFIIFRLNKTDYIYSSKQRLFLHNASRILLNVVQHEIVRDTILDTILDTSSLYS